jgi:hypothetical protein
MAVPKLSLVMKILGTTNTVLIFPESSQTDLKIVRRRIVTTITFNLTQGFQE